jgi:hypothetical protein
MKLLLLIAAKAPSNLFDKASQNPHEIDGRTGPRGIAHCATLGPRKKLLSGATAASSHSSSPQSGSRTAT